ncbi:dermatopontin-like [Pecten maximus]|uniref:dermatopontin-like n=1 Tax=Pecten maximus TaxID=6579 RepID=UPI0014582F24|nr:dermatopontin-like [Pecten maximus]
MLLPAGIRLHVFLVLSLFGGEVLQRTNAQEEIVDFSCGWNRYLTQITSTYNGYDRNWSFGCQPLAAGILIGDCDWTGYINSYDNFFSYVCPNNGLLNGFRSVYDIYYRDRRWEVQCCPIINRGREQCHFTEYLNSYGSSFEYTVPHGEFVRGIRSTYAGLENDRRYAYEVCEFS